MGLKKGEGDAEGKKRGGERRRQRRGEGYPGHPRSKLDLLLVAMVKGTKL